MGPSDSENSRKPRSFTVAVVGWKAQGPVGFREVPRELSELSIREIFSLFLVFVPNLSLTSTVSVYLGGDREIGGTLSRCLRNVLKRCELPVT